MLIDRDTGYILWGTKTVPLGTYSVILRVSDQRGGIDLQTFTVEVLPQNSAPMIISEAPGLTTSDLPYQYRVIARDPDGDAVEFELLEAPTGVTIDRQMGILNWVSPDSGHTR